MREIKFRAWDKKRKEMFYSDFQISADGGIHWWKPEEGYCWPRKDVELMQFTGLKDKNGKEIYEGDILKYYYPHAPENEKGRIKEIRWVGYRYDITDRCSKNWKVIGNLWENPELLKEAR